jgi:hypothetical protein
VFEAVFSERYLAKRLSKQFPCVDPIEDLEQQNSEEQLPWGLWPVIDNIPDEILRNPVSRTVRIGKAVRLQDRVSGPRGRCPRKSPEEDRLAFSRKPPVCIENLARAY